MIKIKLKYILLFILILCLLYILYDNCRCIERFNIGIPPYRVFNIKDMSELGIYPFFLGNTFFNREDAIQKVTEMGEDYIYIDIAEDYKPHLFVYDRNFRIQFNQDGANLLFLRSGQENTNLAIKKSLELDSWLFKQENLPRGNLMCITIISVLDLNLLQLSNYSEETKSIPYQQQLWKNIREFSESNKAVLRMMNKYGIFIGLNTYPESYRKFYDSVEERIKLLFLYETRTQFYDLYQRFRLTHGDDDPPRDDFFNYDDNELLRKMYEAFIYLKYIDDINPNIYNITYLYNTFESLYMRQYTNLDNEIVSTQMAVTGICVKIFNDKCRETIGAKKTCERCLREANINCIDKLNTKFCNGNIHTKVDENLLTFDEFLNFGRLEGKEDPNSIHHKGPIARRHLIFYLMNNILLYYFNLTPEGDFRPTEYAQSITGQDGYYSKSQELLSDQINIIGEINRSIMEKQSCDKYLEPEDYEYLYKKLYSKLYDYNDILLNTIDVFLFSDIVSLFKAMFNSEYRKFLEPSSETQNLFAMDYDETFDNILDTQINRVLSSDQYNYKYREIYNEIDKILNELEFSGVTAEDKIFILGEYLKISQEFDNDLLYEMIYQNMRSPGLIPDPDL